MSHYVYILFSRSLDRYYVGCTGNLVSRLQRHNQHSKGYTGRVKDWELVYQELYESKDFAYKREREIKSWKSRLRIEELIHIK